SRARRPAPRAGRARRGTMDRRGRSRAGSRAERSGSQFTGTSAGAGGTRKYTVRVDSAVMPSPYTVTNALNSCALSVAGTVVFCLDTTFQHTGVPVFTLRYLSLKVSLLVSMS